MAKKCQVTSRQLRRDSVTSRGMNPSAWMDPLRMREGVILVLKQIRTKEIADKLGYLPSGFCHAFKAVFKCTTKEFYKRHRQANKKPDGREECPLKLLFHCGELRPMSPAKI